MSKILNWFSKIKIYDSRQNEILKELQIALHRIANNENQKYDFASALVDQTSKPDNAIAILKSVTETGPDLVLLMEAIQEKFPITNVGKWKNIFIR